jgi:hypothetical protein
METNRLKSVLLLMALRGLAISAPLTFPRQEHTPVLLAIPSADVLLHGQYRLSGRFQYFTSSEIGGGNPDTSLGAPAVAGKPTDVQNLAYSSELLFGIENRAEVGFQYGQVFSLSVKALLLREDLLWPDLVFGVRNLFGSQEATLYGVSDSKSQEELEPESYATLAKSFPSGSRLHLGLSVLTSNKGFASVNGGLEQDLGAGASLGYEVFERFSDFHQVLSLQWKYRNLIALSVGMTEFQSWIRQGGEWGFFLTPSQSQKSGYNSPGITLALQVLGWVPHRDKRTLPERVAILEVRNAELEREVEDLSELKKQVADLQANALAPAPVQDKSDDSMRAAQSMKKAEPAPLSGKASWELAVNRLRSIAEKMQSDLTDPKEIRDLMAMIVGMGPYGVESMKRAAADTSAAFAALRVPALLVMSYSRDTVYVASLKPLCSDPDAQIRREAMTAYVKLGNKAALEDVKRLLSDNDETVAMAAGEAYRQITGQAPPRMASKAAPTRKRGKAK